MNSQIIFCKEDLLINRNNLRGEICFIKKNKNIYFIKGFYPDIHIKKLMNLPYFYK